MRLATTAAGGVSEAIAGRTLPTPQGWFSSRFNQREPASALIHHQHVAGVVTNAWLFLVEDAPDIRVTFLPNGCLQLTPEHAASFILDPLHPNLTLITAFSTPSLSSISGAVGT
jgi:hypothetical protein